MRQALRLQLIEELSGLQILMESHWGQGKVAGTLMLQPFLQVVSRSSGGKCLWLRRLNSKDSASKPTLEILFQSDWFCFEARSHYVAQASFESINLPVSAS